MISSVAVARGCSGPWARPWECPRQPSDPPNVSRADLVYPSVDPHSCLFHATTQEQAQITGGTRLFASAAGTFSGSVSPKELLGRNPDGSCAVGQPLLYEVDMVAFTDTLSF